MAKILTEVDEFSADITVPEGGDARTAASLEAPIQKLTNRSYNHELRMIKQEGIGASCTAILQATTTYNKTQFVAFHDIENNNSGYTIVDTSKIQVPAAGEYLIILSGTATSTDTTNPCPISYSIVIGAVERISFLGYRYSANAGYGVPVHTSYKATITTPATDVIRVYINTNGSNGQAFGVTGDHQNLLNIVRVR